MLMEDTKHSDDQVNATIASENLETCKNILLSDYILDRQAFILLKDCLDNIHLKGSKEKQKYLCCRICDKIFVKSITFEHHFKKHIGEKPYQCMKCTKSYYKVSHLYRHLRDTHKKEDDDKNGNL